VFSENAHDNMVVLVFSGTRDSGTDGTELSLYANENGQIYVQMKSQETKTLIHACLDKPTAVRLHKELRRQISFLEGEVNHGE